MPILNYTRPMLEVHQQRATAEQIMGDHLAACVVGPNFDLYRYGLEQLESATFKSAGQELPYVFNMLSTNAYAVDKTSVSVYAKDLQAQLANLTSNIKLDAYDASIIRSTTGVFASLDGSATVRSELAGVSPQVGDIVSVVATSGGTPKTAIVSGLVGAAIAGQSTVGGKSTTVTDANITIGAGSTYTADRDTTYILTCTTAPTANGGFVGAVFKVTDTAGIEVASTVTVASASAEVAIGTRGVKVTFPAYTSNAKIAVGDAFTVVCSAASVSEVNFDGLRLMSCPVDLSSVSFGASLFSVRIARAFTGYLTNDGGVNTAFIAGDTSVQIMSNLEMYVAGRTGSEFVPFIDNIGTLHVGFRVAVYPYDEGMIEINTVADIQKNFGTIDTANDIAYACYTALEGSAGRTVFAVRTTGTDKAAYLTALRKTETNDSVYAFAILTNDTAVMKACSDFNTELSDPINKRWRETLVGPDFTGDYVAKSTNKDGSLLTAVFIKNSNTSEVTVQTTSADSPFTSLELNGSTVAVTPGDKIRLGINGTDYVVKRVLSGTELLLVSGPETSITSATPISIVKTDNVANCVEYISSVSALLDSLRAVVVYTDRGVYGSTEISNKYLAAYVAGLTSAVEPQQPITCTEVTCLTRASRMYTKYEQSELDKLAANGVMIITQDSKDAPCYIRHQLTTETEGGSLYYENSCVRNFDNISYKVADVLKSYYGRINVTPTALRKIQIAVNNLLLSLVSNATDDLIGSSLVNYENLNIIQDPVFADRILITVDYYLPVPMNGIIVKQAAYAAQVTI